MSKRALVTVVTCALLYVPQVAFADDWRTGNYDSKDSWAGTSDAPTCRGVYVISVGGHPFYVGKAHDVRDRLKEHLTGNSRGSSAVASILNQGESITWAALCAETNEQIEAQLIQHFGSNELGNLRTECLIRN